MTDPATPIPHRMAPERESLGPSAGWLKDTRGALMVVGVVLGALLVGALYHLVSIGDAILWREGAQNAADAAAFNNAVWHARGMNMIVGINIVMSAILALFVAWRLAIVITAVVTLISCIAGCEGAAALVKMIQLDYETIGPTIKMVLSGFNAAEIAVASYAPVVAANRATRTTDAAYTVSSGTVSASLLPNFNFGSVAALSCFIPGKGADGTKAKSPKELWSSILNDNKPKLDPNSNDGAINSAVELGKLAQNSELIPYVSGKMGLGVSLPVQTDAYSVLCRKAIEFGPRQLVGGFNQLTNSDGSLNDIEQQIARDFTSMLGLGQFTSSDITDKLYELGMATTSILLCVPVDVTVTELLNSIWNVVQNLNIEAANDDKAEGGWRNFVPEPIEHGVDMVYEGIKLTSDVKSLVNQILFLIKAPSDDTQCGTPAKVWEVAQNGDAFMRSMAVVLKNPRLGASDAGLEMADGSRTGNLVRSAAHPIWAHAEMYFDGSGNWGNYGANAMWQLRWTARLRRVQPFPELLDYSARHQPAEPDPPAATGGWENRSNVLSVLGVLGVLAPSLEGPAGHLLDALGGQGGVSVATLDAINSASEARKVQDIPTFSAASEWAAQQLLGRPPPDSIRDFIGTNATRNSEIH